MTGPAPTPSLPVTSLPDEPPPEAQAAAPAGATATPRAERRHRHYRLSPQVRQSPKVLAARRANIAKAHAAVRAGAYRPTERRRAASRANILKAHAWRRSPQGNAIARRNALQHGLAVKKLPELLVAWGEGPQDLERHREMVWEVFRPQDGVEEDLVERLAQATWRRMRLFRARARQEIVMWRRLQARGGQKQRLSQEETERRAAVIARRLDQSSSIGDEAFALETRIHKLLDMLVAVRSVENAVGD